MTVQALKLVLACGVLLLIGCGPLAPARSEIAGLVDVGGGRQIYLECRGIGTPTVILVSGTGGAYDEWTHVANPTNPNGGAALTDSAVYQQVSRFTRVCAYDRPGTTRVDGALSPSTPVLQPTDVQNGVADLSALLHAANVPGPFILVGASWGGMIAQLYARTHPNDVSGLVLVDSASEFLETTLTPGQWADWMNKIKSMLMTKNAEVPDYVSSVRELRSSPAPQGIPTVVLSSDKPWDLQVGDTGSTWTAWLQAQNQLATRLNATHISNTNSGHGIAFEQPQLVVDAIRGIIDSGRNPKLTLPNESQRPVRRQYLQIKKQFPETIVFFHLGDFYETFDDDARLASQVCQIVLTGRDMGSGERIPLAGVPYHAADRYLARLIQAGHVVSK